jgi:Acetyltransferase (GNAT) domain
VRRILRGLSHHYRAGGVGGLTRKALDYLQRIIWSDTSWLVYVRALTDDSREVGELVARREIGLRELAECGYVKLKAFPEEIERRFHERNICFGFYASERPATIGWSSPEYLELDRDLRFPCRGAVGLYDFETFEEFRSRGYYTNALMQIARVMRDRGQTTLFIAVDPKNVPSIRGIERAGFRRVLCVTRRRRFGARMVSQYRESNDE